MSNNKGADYKRLEEYEHRITDAILMDVDWVAEAESLLDEEELKDYVELRERYL